MNTQEIKELPTLNSIVHLISKKNPLHSKNIRNYLQSCSDDFLKLAESYLSNYVSFLNSRNCDLEFIVNSYLLMVKDILIEQTRFLKTGKYRYDNLDDVYKNVYSNDEYMFKYMIGVALSQFLWKNHRDMFIFFKNNIKNFNADKYLEIGPGHGIYFMESLSSGNFNAYTGIDISETSLEITKSFINYCVDVNKFKIEFIWDDITQHKITTRYDYITIGEVLEHVKSPKILISSIYLLLNPGGKTYLSTCANAPVIDHIYLYNSIDEIKEDILSSGLKIIDEIIICNDETEEKDWILKKANLSYACIAKREF